MVWASALTKGVTSTGSVIVISALSAGLPATDRPGGIDGFPRASVLPPDPLPPELPRLAPLEEPQGDPGLAARTAHSQNTQDERKKADGSKNRNTTMLLV